MPANQHHQVPNQGGGAIRASLFYSTMGIAFVVVALPIIAIVLFAVFPASNALSFAGAFTNFGPTLADPRLLPAVFNSVGLALSVCAQASP